MRAAALKGDLVADCRVDPWEERKSVDAGERGGPGAGVPEAAEAVVRGAAVAFRARAIEEGGAGGDP